MKEPSDMGDLESRVRELVFDRETSREALNDLLRDCEEARPIAARALVEEGILISELRLENAHDLVQVLEPETAPATRNKSSNDLVKRRPWIGVLVGAAAACLVVALWMLWDRTGEKPMVSSPDWEGDQRWDESVGLMRLLDDDGHLIGEVSVADGEDIKVGRGGARIDLDNGVVISVTGPAQMSVGLHLTTVQQGSIFVEVPDHLGLYAVETDEGRMVDLGSVFSLSVQPGEATEVTFLKGNGETLRNSPQDDVPDSEKRERGEIQLITLDEMPGRPLVGLDNAPLKVPAAYRQMVDAAKPLFVWDFEKVVDGNTIPDRLGSGANGILKGEFELGSADGSGQYLVLGRNGGKGWLDSDKAWVKKDMEPFTFELWARPEHFHWGHLFQLRASPGIDPVFQRPTKGIAAYFCLEFTHLSKFYAGGQRPAVRAAFRTPATEHATDTVPGGLNSQLISPGRYLPGHWHHLVARVGTREFTLFVDGEIVVRKEIERPDNGTQPLMIRLGRLIGKPGLTRQFVGAIDEVALYGEALSDEEIRKHYRVMTNESK